MRILVSGLAFRESADQRISGSIHDGEGRIVTDQPNGMEDGVFRPVALKLQTLDSQPVDQNDDHQEYGSITGHDGQMHKPLLPVGAFSELFLGKEVDEEKLELISISFEGYLSEVVAHYHFHAPEDVAQQEKREHGGHDEVSLLDRVRGPYGVEGGMFHIGRSAAEDDQAQPHQQADYGDCHDFEFLGSIEFPCKTGPVIERGEVAAKDHHGFTRIGAPGTPYRAISAIIAEPWLRRLHYLFFLSQLNIAHHLPGKGVLGRGQITDCRACTTVVALVGVFQPKLFQFSD